MRLPDFTSPIGFISTTLILFLIIIGRYFLVAGMFYTIFYRWYPYRWNSRKINHKKYKSGQFRKEVTWSCITAMIFSLSGTITLILWQKGFTKVYLNWSDYPIWWIPLSLVLSLIVHETYYYWVHRWMHLPKVFKIVHKVHHESNITSPWTAFSFHPLEGLLQAIFLPALVMFVPLHLYVLIFQLTIMTLSSVINHLDIEIYPANFYKHPIGKWLIGASHHSLHHRQFKYNYGLYFTFWDKWKRTESPSYVTLFEEKTKGTQNPSMTKSNVDIENAH